MNKKTDSNVKYRLDHSLEGTGFYLAGPDNGKRSEGMLDHIKNQIDRIKNQGATYVDTSWYPFEEANSLMMWNGNLKCANSSFFPL
jgi:hypothetical protein